MELGFSIDKAGPLSQVSVKIVSLSTVVQLATGAYGWWKARERCLSFCDLLEISKGGGHLVAPSTFNLVEYTYTRQNHDVQGVLVQDNSLIPTKLPKASTAVPSDPGLACLRALTSALLCFFSAEATVCILRDVIPSRLIQFSQEADKFEISGPLHTSLKSAVEAVATEEDSNSYRQSLLKLALEEESRLFKESEHTPIPQSIPGKSADVALATGLIQWVLTPLHRRTIPAYITKSLSVWLLAVLLKAVGFQVVASPILITTEDEYTRYVSDSSGTGMDVHLTVSVYGHTDPFMQTVWPQFETAVKARIMPVRAIPWAAFKHLRHEKGKMNIEHIINVYNYSFAQTQSMRATFKPTDGHLRIQLLNLALAFAPDNDFHTALISAWSPHLVDLCRGTLREYAPATSDDGRWNLQSLLNAFHQYSQGADKPYEGLILPSFYTMQAIILGALYGIITQLLCDKNEAMGKDSEIAFQPGILAEGRLLKIAQTLGRGLEGVMEYAEWTDLIRQVILGADIRHGYTLVGRVTPFSVVGMQANGMVAMSELLVRPSAHPLTVWRFHCSTGQILNLPLADNGLVILSTLHEPFANVFQIPEEPLQTLQPFDDDMPYEQCRIDVEPFWENDPRLAVIRLRRKGKEVARLDSVLLMGRLLRFHEALCLCGRYEERSSVGPDSRWQKLRMESLMPSGLGLLEQGASNGAELRTDQQVLIDARKCHPLQLFVLGRLKCGNLILSSECLKCAWKVFDGLGEKQRLGSAIVITA